MSQTVKPNKESFTTRHKLRKSYWPCDTGYQAVYQRDLGTGTNRTLVALVMPSRHISPTHHLRHSRPGLRRMLLSAAARATGTCDGRHHHTMIKSPRTRRCSTSLADLAGECNDSTPLPHTAHKQARTLQLRFARWRRHHGADRGSTLSHSPAPQLTGGWPQRSCPSAHKRDGHRPPATGRPGLGAWGPRRARHHGASCG